MARIRSVHPDLLISPTAARLTAGQERTFLRLLIACDDQGRCQADPRLLKAGLYPLHDDVRADDVASDLEELERHRLVGRYVTAGKAYLTVRSWGEYQHPNRPTTSRLPGPPDDLWIRDGTKRNSSLPGEGDGDGVGEGEGVIRCAATRRVEVVTPEVVGVAPNGAVSSFSAFWLAYPRKVAKARAETAWRQAARRDSPDVIADGLAGWAAYWELERTDQKFIPHPTTFLTQSRYNDPPPVTRREPAGFAALRRVAARRGVQL